jgi:cytochrome c553
MLKRFLSMVATGVVVGFVAVPARAQDSIESKVQVCAVCHGQNGVPADPRTTPIIWGQQVYYLDKQLSDYRNGARDNPIMTPIAKTLKQEDLRAIAAYFAAKTWPAHSGGPAPGSPPNGIAMCQPCHQEHFDGGPPAPRLAGLSYEYIAAEMNAFADDKRTNNNDMPKIMKMFSASDREAMAHYLAGL